MGLLRKRRHFVALLLVVVLLPAELYAETPPRQADPAKPNLLVVTFDTTRADRIASYGYTQAKTPNIDSLAREGLLFERAYAQSPQTLPSHVSLFTGLYPITTNVVSNGQQLSDEAVTLAEILRGAGYQTAAIVGASPLLAVFNLNQGFQLYHDDFNDSLITKPFSSFFRFFSRGKINPKNSRHAATVSNLAKNWLSEAARQKKPFFLWLHYYDPHYPYESRSDFSKPELKDELGPLNAYGVQERNYVNEIEFADHYLGQVLKQLERQRLAEDTLIVFTADHGESLGEHDYRGHRENVYENIIRVPLIFRFPDRIEAGQRRQTPAMLIDVVPTILSLLDSPWPPNSFQGRNLLTLDENQPRKLYSMAVKLFSKTPIRQTVVYEDLKYILFDDPDNNALYDLAKDPEEMHNLLLAGSNQEVLSILDWQSEIESWFQNHQRLEVTDFSLTEDQLEQLRSLGYVQ